MYNNFHSNLDLGRKNKRGLHRFTSSSKTQFEMFYSVECPFFSWYTFSVPYIPRQYWLFNVYVNLFYDLYFKMVKMFNFWSAIFRRAIVVIEQAQPEISDRNNSIWLIEISGRKTCNCRISLTTKRQTDLAVRCLEQNETMLCRGIIQFFCFEASYRQATNESEQWNAFLNYKIRRKKFQSYGRTTLSIAV